jgi:hypothetical protein
VFQWKGKKTPPLLVELEEANFVGFKAKSGVGFKLTPLERIRELIGEPESGDSNG